jgi:hypothetical protein
MPWGAKGDENGSVPEDAEPKLGGRAEALTPQSQT